MFSYWEKEEVKRPYDMLIIGGGITGLTAAIECKMYRPDIRVGVVEKGRFRTTASTKNAGFACFGSVTEMLSDLKRISEDEFCELIRSRWEGLRLLRQRAGDQYIRFNECGGYEVFKEKESFEQALDSLSRLNELLRSIIGPDVFREVKDVRGFEFSGFEGMLVNRYEGQLDPSRMIGRLNEVARGLNVEYIQGEVKSLHESSYEVGVQLEEVELRASQVIVAVNGLARNLLDLEVRPARAQVLITTPIRELGWQGSFHYDEGFYYFRNVGDRVLLGGGRNLDIAGETTTELALNPTIQAALDRMLADHILPGRTYEVEHRWAGIMGVGDIKKPIVQPVSDRMIAAVRLGGMGVAIGSQVGSRAAHLAVG